MIEVPVERVALINQTIGADKCMERFKFKIQLKSAECHRNGTGIRRLIGKYQTVYGNRQHFKTTSVSRLERKILFSELLCFLWFYIMQTLESAVTLFFKQRGPLKVSYHRALAFTTGILYHLLQLDLGR